MKLFYSPGACSLASHIALCEAGLPVQLVKVDLGSKKTEGNEDFCKINPNGYVPLLALDDSTTLTEGPAILQYVADQVPEKELAPANGTMARYQLQSLLNFIATELHKTCGPMFNPQITDAEKQRAISLFGRRLDYIESLLKDRPWLAGEQFTVADAYLFTVLGWSSYLSLDLSSWTNIVAYLQRVAARPAVLQALKEEGLAG